MISESVRILWRRMLRSSAAISARVTAFGSRFHHSSCDS
jgi:hypothetical protein